MRTINTKFAIAGALVAAFALTGVASAQCASCAVPQTVWSPVVTPAVSPVVVNNVTVNDGWYLGKYLGRANRRVWGTAPAQAQVVGMPIVAAPATTWAAGYAPATTWSAGFAPATTWSAGYAPGCSTCGVSPCGCAQTTFRPVIMQPAMGCNTCNACNTVAPCSSCASGVVTTSHSAPVNTGCSTCASGVTTSNYVESSPTQMAAPATAPALPSNSPAPPQTFRETDRLDPIPAEAAPAGQASDLSAPLLLDANGDKMTKRPTAPVWTAVYKQPAKITSVSAAGAESPPKKSIGWTSGR